MNLALESWLLVFTRIAPIVALHPVFGGRATPSIVKASVACVLATVFWSDRAVASPQGPLLVNAVTQAAIGLAVAAVGIAVFGAIEAAGRFVDDARGANAARLFAPHLEASTSPLGALDAAASLALFWSAGLHSAFIESISSSFDTLPIGARPAGPIADRAAFLTFTVDAIGALCRAGLAMAGPAAAATVTVDAFFGLVNRSSPQAPVFSLSLPVKLVAALAVTALAVPGRAGQWADAFRLHDGWIRSILGG